MNIGRQWRSGFCLIVIWSMMVGVSSGCAFFKSMPEAQSTAQRLRAFPVVGLPLQGPAEIFWNSYQIPFIHAAVDEDVPFLIGMVHAHLRLGQMELLRRAAQGRLAEVFGPFVADVDHLLRIIDLDRAGPKIQDALPRETAHWLNQYTAGINYYVKHGKPLSPELDVLGIHPEPWSLDDVISLGRLSAIDVNWLYWFFSFQIHNEPEWPEIWARLKANGRRSLPSFRKSDGMPVQLFSSAVKSGSNSFVVSGNRSSRGSGLIANDPHLGLMLPNLWLICGFKSPSYHVIGFTIPGIPMILVGRNGDIAWGGTNMLSLSTTFYDISAPEYEPLDERKEQLKIRWWPNRTVTIRESRYGPVVSDTKFLQKAETPRLALKWRGHATSDEFTTFLSVNRASNWEEFRQAFKTYAVSGQNILYADVHGNIGQLLALDFVPEATAAGEQFIGDPALSAHRWRQSYNSTQLPVVFNPPDGFIVSTNNIPVVTDPPVSLLGNSNDRFSTITRRLQKHDPISAKELQAIQTDVYSNNSHALARAIVKQAPQSRQPVKSLLTILADWDGRYTTASQGAAALELVTYHLAKKYYTDRYGKSIAQYLLRSPVVYRFLSEDLAKHDMRDLVDKATRRASKDLAKYPTWGDLHFLRLKHPLGSVPLIGAKYRFGEFPVPGSTNTVMKSAHPLSNSKHYVTYGANARHVSDLSDLDQNHFVLLGGQDGYWSSCNYLDLFSLWQKGQYVKVPLRLKSVRTDFEHHMVFSTSKTYSTSEPGQ